MRQYLAVRIFEHHKMDFRTFWESVRLELSEDEAQQVIDVNFEYMTKTYRNELVSILFKRVHNPFT